MTQAEQIAQWVIDNRYPKSEFDKVSDIEMFNYLKENIQEALDAGELKGFSEGIDSADKNEKKIADWTNVVELRKELAAKEKELQELREENVKLNMQVKTLSNGYESWTGANE